MLSRYAKCLSLHQFEPSELTLEDIRAEMEVLEGSLREQELELKDIGEEDAACNADVQRILLGITKWSEGATAKHAEKIADMQRRIDEHVAKHAEHLETLEKNVIRHEAAQRVIREHERSCNVKDEYLHRLRFAVEKARRADSLGPPQPATTPMTPSQWNYSKPGHGKPDCAVEHKMEEYDRRRRRHRQRRR